jgi:hypothetical protein
LIAHGIVAAAGVSGERVTDNTLSPDTTTVEPVSVSVSVSSSPSKSPRRSFNKSSSETVSPETNAEAPTSNTKPLVACVS